MIIPAHFSSKEWQSLQEGMEKKPSIAFLDNVHSAKASREAEGCAVARPPRSHRRYVAGLIGRCWVWFGVRVSLFSSYSALVSCGLSFWNIMPILHTGILRLVRRRYSKCRLLGYSVGALRWHGKELTYFPRLMQSHPILLRRLEEHVSC